MFKTIAFLIGVVIFGSSVSAQNKPVILEKWDASNKFKDNIMLYRAKGSNATKKYIADDSKPGSGSLKVKILTSKLKSVSDIQLGFIFSGTIEKGTKYRIKISIQSNQPCQISAAAIMHGKPWNPLGKTAYANMNLQPGKSKELTIEFRTGKSFKNIRVPCLSLGKLKPGTELSIKSVVFEKI